MYAPGAGEPVIVVGVGGVWDLRGGILGCWLAGGLDMAAIDGQPLKYVSGCYLLVNCLHLGDSLLRYAKPRCAITSGM